MYTNPKENRTQVDHILLEQFRRKGYKCEEIVKDGSTTFIIKHDKKHPDLITSVVNESYKDLFKTN